MSTTPKGGGPLSIDFIESKRIKSLEESLDQFKQVNADLRENLRINKESLAALILENGKL